MKIPNPVQKAIAPYQKQGYTLLTFYGKDGFYIAEIMRSRLIDDEKSVNEQIELTVNKGNSTEKKRVTRTYRNMPDGDIQLIDEWEISGQELREFLEPTGSKIRHVPRNIPYYGTLDQAVIESAATKLLEFLALAPAFPGKDDAALFLELAANLAEARSKTVRSIHWLGATAQTRRNIWSQLLILESQIAYNLCQFGEWWDTFNESFQACPVTFELPDSIRGNALLSERFQNSKIQELRTALYYLCNTAQEMRESIRVYRGEESLVNLPEASDDTIIEADIMTGNPDEQEILASVQPEEKPVQLSLFE